MEELIRRHVLARLHVPRALRSTLPSLVLPVSAPVASALLLMVAIEARPAPVVATVAAEGLIGGFQLALARAELHQAGVELAGADLARIQEEVAELRALLSALPAAEAEWTQASVQERIAARASLTDLDRHLAELAARVAPASEPRAELEEARAWLDALRMGLNAPSDPIQGLPGAGSGTDDLTSARADGTISRPFPDESKVMPSEPITQPAREPSAALGLAQGNWWPAEYDQVVARWVESSRARPRAR